MRLEHFVRLVISVQIMVATLLLGVGEASPVLPLITLVVLCVSAYVTDGIRWFQLKQPAADLLALAVVIVSAIGAAQTDRQGLLVSVANLQSYLQYVVLFQAKTPRVYWQLALLSLGQMAIASTLVPGPLFGFMLLAYLLVATVGFALLMLHAESAKLSGAAAQRDREVLLAGSSGLRVPVLTGGAAPVNPRSAAGGLSGVAVFIGLITVMVSVPLFFMLPRWNVSNFEVIGGEPLRTVGFSNTVLLGELGEVVNNPDVVMRIMFFRGRGNRAIELKGEPLFRGNVVTRYQGRTWSRVFASNGIMMPADASGPIIRQRITIEPLDVGELFCIFPVVAIDQPDPKLRVNLASDQLIRLDEFRSTQEEFEVGTTGISGNRQRTVLPCEVPISRREMQALSERPPETQFPGLYELAARVVAERNIDPQQDRVAAARALSDYFHTSGEFFYTLTPQQRTETLDPLEDFVTANRGGHCEYFAGALVLMLRSLNIPARMAIGFKGGEWNPQGMYYKVQQLHAHAWVEAYLEPDQVPAGALASEDAPFGAWVMLDPTEGTVEGSAASRNTGLMARFRQLVDYGRVLWINYVASLNNKRQRRGIYEPLAAGVDAAVDNLTSQQVWRGRFDAAENSRVGKFWRWYRRHWFSWRGGLVAVGFSLSVVGAFFGIRWVVRSLSDRGWFGGVPGKSRPPVLEMYRRLEAALSRIDLVRHPAQTAHEFALAAGGELAERVEYRRVAHLPRRVVESFYRVRFGGRTMDSQEAEAVEHALTELEFAVAPRVGR